MIDYTKKLPENYLSDSRDFQMMSRLLTIGLSTSKYHSSTLLHMNNPKIINSVFLPLLLEKVGIVNSRYNYTDEQMIHICSCFSDILKHKGTLKAVDDLCRLYSTCSDSYVSVIPDINDRFKIYITHEDSVDDELLESLIRFVIPFGVEYILQNVSLNENSQEVTISPDTADTYLRNSIDRHSKLFSSNDSDSNFIHTVTTQEIYNSDMEGN